MSNKDNFASGFILGTVVGGLVGGLLGSWLGSRLPGESLDEGSENLSESKSRKKKRGSIARGEGMEMARRSLEDKIAQMNEAIDDLRYQLNDVNGSAVEDDGDRAIAEEP
ncbi:MAG: hypothetical protein F6J93_17465 [Oscillatoria sp. SIO1A7]|nr:hypothetical protein [Oscillatoria sp. SIO1A7]